MSKFKKGDIVKIVKVMKYGGLSSAKEIKEWDKNFVNVLGEITSIGKNNIHNDYYYAVRFESLKKAIEVFYTKELTLATEIESFLFHIYGSKVLKDEQI